LQSQSDPANGAREPAEEKRQSEEQTDQKNQHLEYIGQTEFMGEKPSEDMTWLFSSEPCD